MMRNTLSRIFVVGLIGLTPLAALGNPFTAGDIAVERIGTGTGTLSGTSAAVFVDEYTPTGTLVQTITLPTTTVGAQLAFTDSGSATSDGYLSLSGNGQYLALPGYNAPVGTASVASASGVSRGVARIDWNGNVDTSTTFGTSTAFAGNNMRSAYTTDGTTFWAAGTATTATNGGVWTIQFGATSGTQVSTTTGSPVLTNTRIVKGYGSQLYVSNSTTTAGLNSGVNTVGTGFPTSSGNALTPLPGLDNNVTGPPNGASSPYSYFLADLNPAVPGIDTAYVADDGATTGSGSGGFAEPGGIEKYSLVGGNWVLNNIIGTTADSYRGLTGSVDSSGNVQLFATRQGGTATNPGIVSLLDTAGYNVANNGTPNLIVPLATNTAFRGIDLVPVAPAAVPEPSSLLLASLGAGGLLWVTRRRRQVAVC